MKIKTAKDSLLRLMMTNLCAPAGFQPTPCLMGEKGIGKTQIAKQIADQLDADFDVLQGSLLQDGDVAGFPLAVRNDKPMDATINFDEKKFDYEGYGEVKMIPNPVVRKIQIKEIAFFRTAFNSKRGKNILAKFGIDVDSIKANPYFSREEILRSQLEKLDDNAKEAIVLNRFDDNGDISNKGSQFIRPTVLLIDELNRCQQQVQNELMNFLLSRDSNGYILPFWVLMCATANPAGSKSGYSVREFDSAQLSRLALIEMDTDVQSFIDYAVDKNLNSSIVDFIADNGAEVLIGANDGGSSDACDGKPTPSPRSWEMISYILANADRINTRFFSDAKANENDATSDMLINSIVGSAVGVSFNSYRRDMSRRILSSEILTGKGNAVPEKIIDICNNLPSLRCQVIGLRAVEYLISKLDDAYAHDYGKPSESKTQKSTIENLSAQMIDFIDKIKYKEVKFSVLSKMTSANIRVSPTENKLLYTFLSSAQNVPAAMATQFSKLIYTIIGANAKANELMR